MGENTPSISILLDTEGLFIGWHICYCCYLPRQCNGISTFQLKNVLPSPVFSFITTKLQLRRHWHFCDHAKCKKWYGLLSPLMCLFATCARHPGGNEAKSGCVFRASWDQVEDGILTWAALDSRPAFYLVLGVYRCHEMFFSPSSCTAMASAMSAARASEPHQTGISKPLSWLFRKGDAGTKGGYWQLVHFVAPLRFPNDACALIEITAN